LNIKNALYTTLTKENGAAERDSLINQIASVQAEIENTHYSHFIEIKTLCKPEQQQYFEALTQEISTLFYKRQMPKERLEK
jgi:protein CpxP